MELKEGYKQTEVGVIPADWRIKPLSAVAFFTNGKAHEQFIDDNGNYIVVNSKFISTEGDVFKNSSVCICPLKKGDITMVMSDIPNGKALAKCYIIPKDNKYTLNQRICSLSTDVSEKRFLAYILNRNKYYLAFDSGTGQTNLKKNDVIGCPIPLPPTKAEQIAIATALSDADALIQSLEKLIGKKRNIKQGAMQELLKPKDGWVRKPLKEVSFMKGRIGWQGLKQTEFTMNADEPFLITGMNFKDGAIRWDEVYHVSNERYQIAKEIQLKQNDVLMTKDGTIGKLLYVDTIPSPGKATLNSHLLVFRPIRNSYNPIFLYYQLASKTFKNYVELCKSGSTFFGLSQEAVGDYQAFLPTLTKQTRIATVLSDMDAEIAALETKLAKYKQVKQGMMQELLTGRTRLV